MNHPADVEVNGVEPDIVGRTCEGLFAIEYSHAQQIVEPANVVFLSFASRWHRLYFDSSVVFWRPSDEGPEDYAAEELDATFRAQDLGARFRVVGRQLISIGYEALADGSRVRLSFEGGLEVSFDDRNDITTYAA